MALPALLAVGGFAAGFVGLPAAGTAARSFSATVEIETVCTPLGEFYRNMASRGTTLAKEYVDAFGQARQAWNGPTEHVNVVIDPDRSVACVMVWYGVKPPPGEPS